MSESRKRTSEPRNFLTKKAITSKLTAPKRLFRRVLSNKSLNNTSQPEVQNCSDIMKEDAALSIEIQSLRDQLENLKAAVRTLREDTEKKDEAIAKLAREKEEINLDLLKQKRSNCSIKQQLEEERSHYYKEKEVYCHEMNEMKKLKKNLSSTTSGHDEKDAEALKNDIEKLKQTVKQTLEANYNLSIKFLRMKNTKTCLKTELKTMQLEHEKLANDYKTRIETLSTQLNELICEKMNTPISISSKKYLQLVKQNSCLVYENLCLQLEVDNLNVRFEKIKMEKTKSETNSRLKFITRHNPKESSSSKNNKQCPKEQKRVRIQEETPEKLEKETMRHSKQKKKSSKNKEEIVKIFERTTTKGTPQITIIDEKDLLEQGSSKTQASTPKINEQKNCLENTRGDFKTVYNKFDNAETVKNAGGNEYLESVFKKNSSKLTLFQVSSVPSTISTLNSRPFLRVNSSPEIVQTSQFRKAH